MQALMMLRINKERWTADLAAEKEGTVLCAADGIFD